MPRHARLDSPGTLHHVISRGIDGKGPQVGTYTETRVVVDGAVTGEMKSDIVGQLPAFTDPSLEGYRKRLEKWLISGFPAIYYSLFPIHVLLLPSIFYCLLSADYSLLSTGTFAF